MERVNPSAMDVEFLARLRENVIGLMKHAAAEYARAPGRLLDIAPEVHEGARPLMPIHYTVITRKR